MHFYVTAPVKLKKKLCLGRLTVFIKLQLCQLMRLWHFIALCKPQSSNTHAQQSTGATRLIYGQTLCLLPCANSKGSGETGRMRSLA